MKAARSKTSTMHRLADGVRRFRKHEFPERRGLFEALAAGQQPHTLFIACADSRVMPELMTQAKPGEMFVCRNIGNIVPAYGEMLGGISAVVEYACTALEVTDIIVCGHSDCGAMKALLSPDDPKLATMPTVRSWLRNAESARSVVDATRPGLPPAERLQTLVVQNVRTQLSHLGTHPAVAARMAMGTLALHGWVYDIESGRIDAMEGSTGELVPMEKKGRRYKARGVLKV